MEKEPCFDFQLPGCISGTQAHLGCTSLGKVELPLSLFQSQIIVSLPEKEAIICSQILPKHSSVFLLESSMDKCAWIACISLDI